jgi:hypothetical protein
MNRRNFIITSAAATCSIPFLGLSSEVLSRKYHKITKDWSITCASITNWNDFNVYSKLGLSKNINSSCSGELDNRTEYILRSPDVPCIYVNKDKYYKISNFKGDFVENTNHNFYETSFDIVDYLGGTPTERIIIISGSDYCIYALGRDYYKESEGQFGKGWILDRREVYRPLTEKMHSSIKYHSFNRKTYAQYLVIYETKLKELCLI